VRLKKSSFFDFTTDFYLQGKSFRCWTVKLLFTEQELAATFPASFRFPSLAAFAFDFAFAFAFDFISISLSCRIRLSSFRVLSQDSHAYDVIDLKILVEVM
jgi:hypothetical protein